MVQTMEGGHRICAMTPVAARREQGQSWKPFRLTMNNYWARIKCNTSTIAIEGLLHSKGRIYY
jgi:hypothetical protein